MKAFYSDQFVLPLPAEHSVPDGEVSSAAGTARCRRASSTRPRSRRPRAALLGSRSDSSRRRIHRCRARRGHCPETRSGASASRGRRRWSNAPVGRWLRRWRPARPRSSGARRGRPCDGRGTLQGIGKSCWRHAPRVRRSWRGVLRVQRRRGRDAACSRPGSSAGESPSSIATSTRATGRRPSSGTIPPCSRFRPTAATTTRSGKRSAISTSSGPTARPTMSTSRPSRRTWPRARRAPPDLVFYLAGADPYEGDRWGRLKLTIQGLRQRDASSSTRARPTPCRSPSTMAGGYAPDVEAIVHDSRKHNRRSHPN